MKPVILVLICTFFISMSCKKDSSRAEDEKRLSAMYAELQQLSESVICKNEGDWRFVGIGSKACGGVSSFIAYSSKIDTVSFLRKAEKYTSAQAEFNKRWGIISDCSLMLAPDDVVCEEGRPKLWYKNRFD